MTQARDFATLAWGFRETTLAQGGIVPVPAGPDTSISVEFRYVAPEQLHEIQLPGLPLGRLATFGPLGPDFTQQSVKNPSSGETIATLSLFRPGNQNPTFVLDHTSFGSWNAGRTDPSNPNRVLQNYGDFVYGVATSDGDVPRTGIGTYQIYVFGDGFSVLGTARLVFDFGAGTLAGQMDATLNDGIGGLATIGRHELANATYRSGDTSFEGRFASPGAPSGFEGRFTGPNARELMGRWALTVNDPHNPGRIITLYGIWAGKRI